MSTFETERGAPRFEMNDMLLVGWFWVGKKQLSVSLDLDSGGDITLMDGSLDTLTVPAETFADFLADALITRALCWGE